MREIRISDITVAHSTANEITLTFREKVEAAKLLDRLGVSVIELGKVSGGVADNLLIKTIAASVEKSIVAVDPGLDAKAIESTWEALKEASSPRFQVCAALSTARIEYVYHKKPDDMLKAVQQTIAECIKYCKNVEFVAEDATRASADYMYRMISAAIAAGASTVTICDTAGTMLPIEFGDFIKDIYANVPELKDVVLGVKCSNAMNLADASTAAAISVGASEVKVTAMPSDTAMLENVTKILSAKSSYFEAECKVNTTEIKRVLKSIERLTNKTESSKSPFEDGVRDYSNEVAFTANDSFEEVMKGVTALGYDLGDMDKMRIWKAFKSAVQRKESVRIEELEAIIASEAMQVPAAYTLENYVITTGNDIDIIAHIKLKKDNKIYNGLSLGDGPVDAAFLAIEQITGTHYELDDFQIQSISEGREAMGQTIVKLRSGGKVYSGRGLSTDVVGSAVAAYVNALNKITYEEANS